MEFIMESTIKQQAQELVRKARVAQAVYETLSQKQYDQAAKACAKIVYDTAEDFAREAVEETGMGLVESKIKKQRNIAKNAWFYAKGKKSKGVVGWEKGKLQQDCILKIAKPVGVVAAILPSTNPTSAMGGTGLQALKGGNAIIFCPHPKAKNVSLHCFGMIREAIAQLGIPADVVQICENPSVEMTQALMREVDVVVATGGPGMVKEAYSSGRPALGVGQGNCQVVIDSGMQDSFDFLAAGLVENRFYDNGIPCTGEQTIIVPKNDHDSLIAALERCGALYIDDDTAVDKLRKMLFVYSEEIQDYMLNRKITGLNVQELGEYLGITVPADKKLIVLKLNKFGEEELLCREKLCPVTGCLTYSGDWREGIQMAKANLLVEGAGHSSDIYSKDKQHQIYAGEELPVCRLIVNNSNSIISGGSYTNGFITTCTLGCGVWGGCSFGENMTFEHLLNYTRIFYTVESEREPPTDEEIWGDE